MVLSQGRLIVSGLQAILVPIVVEYLTRPPGPWTGRKSRLVQVKMRSLFVSHQLPSSVIWAIKANLVSHGFCFPTLTSRIPFSAEAICSLVRVSVQMYTINLTLSRLVQLVQFYLSQVVTRKLKTSTVPPGQYMPLSSKSIRCTRRFFILNE